MADINDILPLLPTAEPRLLDRIHGILTHRLEVPKNSEIDVRSITFTDAAKRLGVGRSTIDRMAKCGFFKTVNLSGVRRVNLCSFLEYCQGRSELVAKK